MVGGEPPRRGDVHLRVPGLAHEPARHGDGGPRGEHPVDSVEDVVSPRLRTARRPGEPGVGDRVRVHAPVGVHEPGSRQRRAGRPPDGIGHVRRTLRARRTCPIPSGGRPARRWRLPGSWTPTGACTRTRWPSPGSPGRQPGTLESVPDEVHDRIDWVLVQGPAEGLATQLVGETGGPDVDIEGADPSHRPPRRAVCTLAVAALEAPPAVFAVGRSRVRSDRAGRQPVARAATTAPKARHRQIVVAARRWRPAPGPIRRGAVARSTGGRTAGEGVASAVTSTGCPPAATTWCRVGHRSRRGARPGQPHVGLRARGPGTGRCDRCQRRYRARARR